MYFKSILVLAFVVSSFTDRLFAGAFVIGSAYSAGAGTSGVAAIGSAGIADKASACCSAISAPCCMMAISAGMSAISLLDTSASSAARIPEVQCQQGTLFCGPGAPEVDTENPDYTTGGGPPEIPASSAPSDETRIETPYGFITKSEYNQIRKATLARAQNSIDKAKEAGATLSDDGKSISLADGRSIPLSSMGSAAGMKAAGLSASEADQVLDFGEKAKALIAQDLRKYGFGYAGGAGGKGHRKAAKKANPSGPDYNKLLNQFLPKKAENQARGVANVGALSKNLSNGEKIGVASDNLFHMVHRRYKKKTGERSFLP